MHLDRWNAESQATTGRDADERHSVNKWNDKGSKGKLTSIRHVCVEDSIPLIIPGLGNSSSFYPTFRLGTFGVTHSCAWRGVHREKRDSCIDTCDMMRGAHGNEDGWLPASGEEGVGWGDGWRRRGQERGSQLTLGESLDANILV